MRISFLDACPGSGKTQFLVESSVSLLTSNSTRSIVYAAPTLRLMLETRRRILRRLSRLGLQEGHRVLALNKVSPTQFLSEAFSKSSPSHAGKVILTTHEALLRLRLATLDFSSTTLFFDETIQLVMEQGSVGTATSLPSSLVEIALEGDYRIAKYRPSSREKTPMSVAISKLVRSTSTRSVETYVALRQTLKGFTGTAFVVWDPRPLLQAFASTVITAAFFKTSQLYLFLKHESWILDDLLASASSAALRGIAARAAEITQRTVARCRVVALLESQTMQVMTSKLLAQGLVLPPDTDSSVITEEQIKQPRESSVTAPHARPPLFTILDRLLALIPADRKLLVVPNSPGVGYSKTWGGVPYADLVSTAFIYGPPRRALNVDLLRSTTKNMLALLEERDHQLLNEVSRRAGLGTLSLAESPALHGLNSLMDHEVFAHFAALNPTPAQHILLNALIPGYQADVDQCTDSIAQLLFRTSLRDPAAEGIVHVVLPFEATIALLEAKLGLAPQSLRRKDVRLLKAIVPGKDGQDLVPVGPGRPAERWAGLRDHHRVVRNLRLCIKNAVARAHQAFASGRTAAADKSMTTTLAKLKELRQLQRNMETQSGRPLPHLPGQLPSAEGLPGRAALRYERLRNRK